MEKVWPWGPLLFLPSLELEDRIPPWKKSPEPFGTLNNNGGLIGHTTLYPHVVSFFIYIYIYVSPRKFSNRNKVNKEANVIYLVNLLNKYVNRRSQYYSETISFTIHNPHKKWGNLGKNIRKNVQCHYWGIQLWFLERNGEPEARCEPLTSFPTQYL